MKSSFIDVYMEVPASNMNITRFVDEDLEDRMYRHFSCFQYFFLYVLRFFSAAIAPPSEGPSELGSLKAAYFSLFFIGFNQRSITKVS